MSAILDLVLGIVTSVGGFVEAGSISTAAQAGSEFGLQLLWAIAAATIMLALMMVVSTAAIARSQTSTIAAPSPQPTVGTPALDDTINAGEAYGEAPARRPPA